MVSQFSVGGASNLYPQLAVDIKWRAVLPGLRRAGHAGAGCRYSMAVSVTGPTAKLGGPVMPGSYLLQPLRT